MITVVIPYFQRTPGVLRKALASVAAQRGCTQAIEVLVIDDASPVPAADEVAASDSLAPLGERAGVRGSESTDAARGPTLTPALSRPAGEGVTRSSTGAADASNSLAPLGERAGVRGSESTDAAREAIPTPTLSRPAGEGVAIRVITQPNAGPGAARNTGLANLSPATHLVAFLDSDDEWSPDHLARAEAALGAAYDLYFADHFQLGQTVGAFARAGRIVPSEHPVLPTAHEGLHAYRGDLLDQIIRGNVIGTSTVVFDARRFPKQRFRPEFFNAGEDYLFWMDLARAGARACFSAQAEATYGAGVNVYSGAGWGTEQHLLRVHNEMRFKKLVRREFALDAVQRAHVDASVVALRRAFGSDLLHRVSHGKRTSTALLARHLRLDPLSFLQVPATALGKLARRS